MNIIEFLIRCLIIFAMTLLIIGLIGISIDSPTIKSIGQKETKCYDKFSNEIKDAICYEKRYCTKFGFLREKCK